MEAPRVFISYSHDSEEHKGWVRQLASDLRSAGIDVILDQWDLRLGEDLVAFMVSGITKSVRVLMVCTGDYVSKANEGVGGVGYERLVVTQELVAQVDTRKFLPLVRENSDAELPSFLGPRLFVDFRDESDYSSRLDELIHELHNRPRSAKPPLGQSPFSSVTPEPAARQRETSETGRTRSGESILNNDWFVSEAEAAQSSFDGKGGKASMELRFGLHSPVSKSQLELLNAVRSSEIHTFGWPIAVTLENRDEFRPRPYSEGIRAEIVINEGATDGSPSYDYWACHENGDFYLLKSLFEDNRSEDKIFFNTRIVRVAESLMFAANLYEHLGAPGQANLSVRVTHAGLEGRVLSTSNPSRHISPSTAAESVSAVEFVSTIGKLRSDTTGHVVQVLEPMFMLFDFKQFALDVYDDIVERYRNGEAT